MAKTRSQTGNISIKKEEDSKDNLLLNRVTMTTRSKIARRIPPKIKNRFLPVPQVKVEEDADTKALFQSTSNHSKLPKRTHISQEQISQLIDYIVNDNMSPTKAALKVKMDITAAGYYYKLYKNDPEKKVPSPRIQFMSPIKSYTQENIDDLIRYIVDDKMSTKEASTKADMTYPSGRYYYNKYLKDPDHNIPIPSSHRNYTYDQINELIGYIVNGKMSIKAASKKAKMGCTSALKYYHKYFEDQNPDITAPRHIITPKIYTQEQINKLVGYITDDKMTIAAASKKINMCNVSASNYYHQYLKNHNMEIPVSKFRIRYTQDEINRVVGYIVDDKMTIKAASTKANIAGSTARKHYYQYLKDNNLAVPIRKSITKDQINKLIGYIIDDKMTITAASKKAKICYYSSKKYYLQYLNNQKRDAPV